MQSALAIPVDVIGLTGMTGLLKAVQGVRMTGHGDKN